MSYFKFIYKTFKEKGLKVRFYLLSSLISIQSQWRLLNWEKLSNSLSCGLCCDPQPCPFVFWASSPFSRVGHGQSSCIKWTAGCPKCPSQQPCGRIMCHGFEVSKTLNEPWESNRDCVLTSEFSLSVTEGQRTMHFGQMTVWQRNSRGRGYKRKTGGRQPSRGQNRQSRNLEWWAKES